MLEAKRAAVAEVQRAIAAAAAETREVERLRVRHRFFESPMQRNHGHSIAHGIGHGPLLRVVETTTCSPTAGTTTSTTTTASNLSGGRDEDKESLPLLGSVSLPSFFFFYYLSKFDAERKEQEIV